MNQHLKNIQDILRQNSRPGEQNQEALLKELALADKHWSITSLKLDRTEKLKHATTTLLNEAIAELEKTRKLVEEKNRELEIEAALERVRARTMAMQHSNELQEVVNNVYERLSELEVEMDGAAICTFIENSKDYHVWIGGLPEKLPIKFNNLTQVQRDYNGVIERRDELFTKTYSGKIKKEYISFLLGETVLKSTLPEDQKQMLIASDFFTTVISCTKNTAFQLYRYNGKPFLVEETDILKRFAKVFEQAYIRFLDLQKAEAQARESQIQLALERVRARTMAMHRSEELAETAQVLFHQLNELGAAPDRISIGIANEKANVVNFWTTDQSGSHINNSFVARLNERTVIAKAYDAWKQNKTSLVIDLQGNGLKEWIKFAREEMGIIVKDENIRDRRVHNLAFFSHGWILVTTHEPQSPETIQLLERFASVFSLTYRRFLDLEKAEAQAREATIEAALERIRARTMAMHESKELHDVIETVTKQLLSLGIKFDNASFCKVNENRSWELWISTPQQSYPTLIHVPYFDHEQFNRLNEQIASGADFFTDVFDQNQARKFFEHFFENTIARNVPEERKQYVLNSKGYARSVLLAKDIWFSVGIYQPTPFSDENNSIFKRFAKVFEQAYTRFLDLQKAEVQAKEATIEAALEKVRAKAMAMHNSNDLSITASTVFTELRKLGIEPIRCGVGLLNRQSRKAQLYSAASSAGGDSLSLIGWVLLTGHPVLEKIYETWLSHEDYFPELSGEQLKSYYQLLLAGLPVTVPKIDEEQKQYGHFFPFSVGCLYAWSDTPYNENEIKILKRFAAIVDLTFRRYLELQTSEANTREAIKQAALDRIRADIASMRTINDLDRITPLIWNELTILGIPFIRCGVFIMDETQQLIHTFLSTPEGKAIAAFHLRYDTPGNLRFVVSNWKGKSRYIDHWNKSEFHQFAETLVQQGALDSAETYLKTIPQGGFYLHFLPFLQGMLYVGNTDQLSDEQIELIQHVADAFSTAYARYEDFNKLEAAKQTVEKTLTDLRQAQQQLVQAEKMASLGELTAGIAHEIQNPLNFVNNFSEVSAELLDEMMTELGKGDTGEAKIIANDIKQNLEKINHHGKRADAIVKGMLQHSRTSTGKKESTDINALCDEYLRLAYHGLRAKDKSFNAKFESDFDSSIDKLSIIPQEIGRVILNLINNAFYAVSEKKKLLNGTYEPTVSVSTKKLDGKVEIKVKDNGNGIQSKALDKIFQPFFTTKPTGEGTGLGLSLSYDIITKGHGGEIRVETKEKEGTEFIIELPTNSAK